MEQQDTYEPPLLYDKRKREEAAVEHIKARLKNWYNHHKKEFTTHKVIIVTEDSRGHEVLKEREENLTLNEFYERYMMLHGDAKIAYKKYQDKMINEFKDFRTKAEEFFKEEDKKKLKTETEKQQEF